MLYLCADYSLNTGRPQAYSAGMEISHENEASFFEAERVTALPKYYPTFCIDEDKGEVQGAQIISPGGMTVDCVYDEAQKCVMFRQAGHGVGLDKCQDYGALSIGGGIKRAVVADGVSCAVASQSVANLVTHKTIDGLQRLGGKSIDEQTMRGILSEAHLDVAVKFDVRLLEAELDEGFKQHFAGYSVAQAAREKAYGSSTLSFMVVNGGNADIGMFGSGAYIIFRDGRAVKSYASKERCPAQVVPNMDMSLEKMRLFHEEVLPDDVLVLMSDGLLNRGQVEDAGEFIRMVEKIMATGATLYQSLYRVFLKFPSKDDKTMAVLLA